MKIKGTQKADKLYGGDEADIIKGRGGDDDLYGSYGDDVLKGGKGRDVLYGGDGSDRLTGGKGKDFFHVNAESFDLITDFEAGKDVIVFNDLDGEFDLFSDLSDFSYSQPVLLYLDSPVVSVDGFAISRDSLFVT